MPLLQDPIDAALAPVLDPLHVQLDWPAYFKRFCQEHGEPVQWRKGLLLFPDGWTYSSMDYAGPEWPPNTDERLLRKDKEAYWRIRLRIVRAEAVFLDKRLDGLKQWQTTKSVPLQQISQYLDSDNNRVVERVDLDLTALAGRLEWLWQDVKQCEEKIKELATNGNKNER
jgi:hypothetical protein